MQGADIIDGQIVISLRELIADLKYSHRFVVDPAVKKFGLENPPKNTSPVLQLFEALGEEHEAKYVEVLRCFGEARLIEMPAFRKAALARAATETRDAIESGVPTIIHEGLMRNLLIISSNLVSRSGKIRRCRTSSKSRP